MKHTVYVVLLIIISIDLVVTWCLFLYRYSVIIVITFDTKESPLMKEMPSPLRQNAPITFEE